VISSGMSHDPDLYDLDPEDMTPVSAYWKDTKSPTDHSEAAYEASRMVLRGLRSVAIVVGTAIWPRKS